MLTAEGLLRLHVTCHQILVLLPAHDHASVAVAAEDHRRPRDAVVVVRERVAVCAGHRRDEDVARDRIVQRRVADEHVAGLAMLAGDLEVLGGSCERAISDQRLVHRSVQHRPEIVRHAAVDRDPPRDVALDGLHGVERDRRVGHQRAPGLQQQSLVRAELRVQRAHQRLDVLAHRRRALRSRVGDAETAAEVVYREVPERRDRPHRSAEWLELEQLRADVEMQADEIQMRHAREPLDRVTGLLHREAELRIGLAGRDRSMGVTGDARSHPDQHRLTVVEFRDDLLEALELVKGVEHDMPDPGSDCLAQLHAGLGVAVKVDPGRVKPGPECQCELAS